MLAGQPNTTSHGSDVLKILLSESNNFSSGILLLPLFSLTPVDRWSPLSVLKDGSD